MISQIKIDKINEEKKAVDDRVRQEILQNQIRRDLRKLEIECSYGEKKLLDLPIIVMEWLNKVENPISSQDTIRLVNNIRGIAIRIRNHNPPYGYPSVEALLYKTCIDTIDLNKVLNEV